MLITALAQDEGAMLFVSHDRHFLAALSTRVLELAPEGRCAPQCMVPTTCALCQAKQGVTDGHIAGNSKNVPGAATRFKRSDSVCAKADEGRSVAAKRAETGGVRR
jgi:ATPase subunit of ABC transporter with duplicated ATPase domains